MFRTYIAVAALVFAPQLVDAAPKKQQKPAPVVDPSPKAEEDVAKMDDAGISAKPFVNPDPVPPPQPEAKVLAKDEAPAEEAARKPKIGLFFAVRVSGQGMLAGPLVAGFQLGAEIGYRIPVLDGLFGVSVAPSYFHARFASAATSSAQAFSLPFFALVHIAAGSGLARVGVGPALTWITLSEITPFNSVRDDSSGVLGLNALAGYMFALPQGRLGLEAKYSLLPYVYQRQTFYGHALGLELSFAYEL